MLFLCQFPRTLFARIYRVIKCIQHHPQLIASSTSSALTIHEALVMWQLNELHYKANIGDANNSFTGGTEKEKLKFVKVVSVKCCV